jgi:hypothetical protein
MFSTLITHCGHLRTLAFHGFALRVEDLQLGAAYDREPAVRKFVFSLGTVALADNESNMVETRLGMPAMKEVFKTLIRRKATCRLAFLVFDADRMAQRIRGDLPAVFLELRDIANAQFVPYVPEKYHGARRIFACIQWDMRRQSY